MPRGIDTAPKTSINPTDQTSKRGVESPAPAAAYVLGPTGAYLTRGLGVAPSDTETLLPR
jgi:hypothetical protein